ncbi:hypothetical protein A9264_07725 [Vibrio sp. UCD-FRSSP16_10]|uniref:hypothetical protein n=1 Tax=unclassified Vibrio TaxID=2614977 RepID=UPI0007FBC62E|nr:MULTISPECIES: hypothetical protein [unclassified Vibrio]OBT07322.1 hypothetical protein A9260_08510 [Vibrio sp. UCD-FRSSP16_30]OBT12801.1 hypothetical protein A9264_07725 [Vibrio sp. UCD-FRSSP16_10]
MKVKALGAILLGSALLFGCASMINVPWTEASSTVKIEQTDVALNASVWRNKMPTLNESKTFALHGTVVLSSDKMIPADVIVKSIWLRHDDEVLQVDEGSFDVEAINEQQWKVSFKQDDDFNGEISNADLAVELDNGTHQIWLVNSSIDVDTVY